jgi:uncharacterized protein
MAQPLAIIGASVRAACQSALRAGWAPWGADLFADRDLVASCPAVRCAGYPRGLASLVRTAPPGPWMYTGALENHPLLVDQIARTRPLYGNAGRVLRRVRDPRLLHDALCAAGLPVPAILLDPRAAATDGSWLAKPIRGCGGRGIFVWRANASAARRGTRTAHGGGYYFQRRIAGLPIAAIFVAARGRAHLLGATEQLIGAAWCGAGEFAYAGSIGPLALSTPQRSQLEDIGHVVAARFELTGLFGVDAIVDERHVWPVEVNPRYTASVEVIEHAASVPAIELHAAACRDGALPDAPAPPPCGRVYGKAIVFARRGGRFLPPLAREAASAGEWSWSPWADSPEAGSQIAAGHPILTARAAGTSRDEVLDRLRELVNTVYQALASAALR